MKKLITTVAALLIMGTVSFAQSAKTETKATTTTSTHVKKDGTPDKRFKENKTVTSTKTTATGATTKMTKSTSMEAKNGKTMKATSTTETKATK